MEKSCWLMIKVSLTIIKLLLNTFCVWCTFRMFLTIGSNNIGLLDASDFTLENIGKADLLIYITDNLKDNLLGMADVGVLCLPPTEQKEVCSDRLGCSKSKPANAWKFSINEYLKSVASMGKVCF